MTTADTIFTPYTHVPAHVAQDYEDDELFALNCSIHDLAENGFEFQEFYLFVRDRVVFLTPETSIVAYCHPPSHHEYVVDMIFGSSNTNKKKTLHIAGFDAEATSPAINELVELFVASHREEESVEITFKCFATNPRKPLGSLSQSSLSTLGRNNPSCKLSFVFQFLALKEEHCEAIFNSCGAAVVEFRQCTVDGLGNGLKRVDGNGGVGPKKVKISCAQSELVKVADGLRGNSTLGELDLLMHFMLGADDIQQLTSALQDNMGLQRLCLEYLDMDDASWDILLASLKHHPTLRVLDLAFTEKFSDSVRRLDAGRRRTRTKAILHLVETNKNLVEVTWPIFQQDEELMPAIRNCLDANRGASP
jgi:hypothetical protein